MKKKKVNRNRSIYKQTRSTTTINLLIDSLRHMILPQSLFFFFFCEAWSINTSKHRHMLAFELICIVHHLVYSHDHLYIFVCKTTSTWICGLSHTQPFLFSWIAKTIPCIRKIFFFLYLFRYKTCILLALTHFDIHSPDFRGERSRTSNLTLIHQTTRHKTKW